jgi:hypothetical protein
LDVNQIIADAVPIVVSVLQEPFSGSQPQVLEKVRSYRVDGCTGPLCPVIERKKR